MSWEQEISEQLQAAWDTTTVRFDIEQNLSEVQKNKARNNIGYGEISLLSNNEYKIEF